MPLCNDSVMVQNLPRPDDLQAPDANQASGVSGGRHSGNNRGNRRNGGNDEGYGDGRSPTKSTAVELATIQAKFSCSFVKRKAR